MEDSSLNIAIEVKVCDEFREVQNCKVEEDGSAVERVFGKQIVTDPVKDEPYVPTEEEKMAVPENLKIKCEPVDVDHDLSESVLLSDGLQKEDPQAEQKIFKETTCGTLGAAAAYANGGEGPLCKEEEELHMQPCPAGDPKKGLQAEIKQEPEGEGALFDHGLPFLESFDLGLELHSGTCRAAALNIGEGPLCKEEEEQHIQPCPAGDPEKGLQAELKQEQEGEPLTPGHPLPGSEEGLKVQCVCSMTTRSDKVREMLRQHGGSSEHGGAGSKVQFSPRHYRASRKLRSEKKEGPTSHLKQQQNGRSHGPPDGTSGEMVFPLVSQGEGNGSFAQPSHLKSHQTAHTGEKPHRCEECGKSFSYPSSLSAHQRVHTGEKPYSCEECGKSFSYPNSLKSHQMVHTGKKPHRCEECGRSFAFQPNLKIHQRVHSGEKPHSCEVCGKRFSQQGYLKIHQLVHSGEKPHSCEECGKSFTQLSNLRTHQMIHTGEKPHRCGECGKSFPILCKLKIHQRVHTGEKPHGCDECGKSFSHLYNLKTHQRVHTREKPHACTLCNKSFSHLVTLKIHQGVHATEKPHSCDECGKSFPHLYNLKTHQRVHTREKPHACTLCGKSFSQNVALQRHMLTHS